MAELLIPYASSPLGRLVPWWAGRSGETYACPQCLSPVVFRRPSTGEGGEVVRRSHFAHRSDAACAAESVIHAIAKRLVAQAAGDWVAGVGRRPMLEMRCECGAPREPVPLPGLRVVELEKGVRGYIADVRVDGGEAAIEVVHTHAIEDSKRAEYRRLRWWVEVEAQPLLEDPSRWVVTASGGDIQGRTYRCGACIDQRLAAVREGEASLQAAGRELRRLEELREELDDRTRSLPEKEAVYRLQIEELDRERLRKVEALGPLRAEVALLEARKDAAEDRDKSLLLVDLRKAETMYREVLRATEALRVREMRLAEQVRRHEVALGLRSDADDERFRDVCPGCGLRSVEEGRCVSCGRVKQLHGPANDAGVGIGVSGDDAHPVEDAAAVPT